jgi:molecular chaperone GrpE
MTKKKTDTTEQQEGLEMGGNGFEEKYLRALADYQNLERRIEREKELLVKLASSVLLIKLLPVLDNLERAQSHLKDSGLEHVVRQFKDALATEGVSEIKAEGEFNPELHEAITDSEGDEGKIVEILEKGYKIGDRVLRPAKVKVGKGSRTDHLTNN